MPARLRHSTASVRRSCPATGEGDPRCQRVACWKCGWPAVRRFEIVESSRYQRCSRAQYGQCLSPDRSRLARKVAVVWFDAHENVMAGGPASRGDLRHGGSPSLTCSENLTGKVAPVPSGGASCVSAPQARGARRLSAGDLDDQLLQDRLGEGLVALGRDHECARAADDVVLVIAVEVGLERQDRQAVDADAGATASSRACVTARPRLLEPSPDTSMTRRSRRNGACGNSVMAWSIAPLIEVPPPNSCAAPARWRRRSALHRRFVADAHPGHHLRPAGRARSIASW